MIECKLDDSTPVMDNATDEEVGALFATVFTDIFNFEVPTFKVN